MNIVTQTFQSCTPQRINKNNTQKLFKSVIYFRQNKTRLAFLLLPVAVSFYQLAKQANTVITEQNTGDTLVLCSVINITLVSRAEGCSGILTSLNSI